MVAGVPRTCCMVKQHGQTWSCKHSAQTTSELSQKCSWFLFRETWERDIKWEITQKFFEQSLQLISYLPLDIVLPGLAKEEPRAFLRQKNLTRGDVFKRTGDAKDGSRLRQAGGQRYKILFLRRRREEKWLSWSRESLLMGRDQYS